MWRSAQRVLAHDSPRLQGSFIGKDNELPGFFPWSLASIPPTPGLSFHHPIPPIDDSTPDTGKILIVLLGIVPCANVPYLFAASTYDRPFDITFGSFCPEGE